MDAKRLNRYIKDSEPEFARRQGGDQRITADSEGPPGSRHWGLLRWLSHLGNTVVDGCRWNGPTRSGHAHLAR